MKMVEKEAKTKEEAVKLALEELGASEKDVKIEYLQNGKRSFLGLGKSKPAKVRVYLVIDNIDNIIAFITDLLKKMGFESKITLKEETEDQILLNIESKDSGIIIGKHGKTLESLQYLINIIHHKENEKNKKILLDTENYRQKREDTLKNLAKNIAQKVRKTKKYQILEEMNPYERRIIHLTLENESDIETTSIGRNRTNKRVKIFLKH